MSMYNYQLRPFRGSSVCESFILDRRAFINDRCIHRFINSMPMIFAFRIVDCFFCMGPKVLFQVG